MRRFHPALYLLFLLVLLLGYSYVHFEQDAPAPFSLEDRYSKQEYDIPMRDGVRLRTIVYTPRDHSQAYPMLIKRTPYSAGPYGEEMAAHIGPTGSTRFAEEGYIFVYQDVRGRFMSEGQFLNMTPHKDQTKHPDAINESTDMYDTVEWLLEKVHPNNGRVGLWGISYPGYYVASSIIDTHPAIKAASPQAPIGDWFVGDDFHHNGAFFLQDAFRFFSFFEHPEPNPTSRRRDPFDYGTQNAYDFFLSLGPLRTVNDNYFHHEIAFWDSLAKHDTYDAFWQQRNIIPHLKNITTPVMTVAGWFDAEDPYGPLQIYQAIEANNTGIPNTLVVGPWFHGAWVRGDGSKLNNISFGSSTAHFYQEQVDLPFFNYYLKDKGTLDLPEVLAFSSGDNQWHRLDAWPPENRQTLRFYFEEEGRLVRDTPHRSEGLFYDAYQSDPADPVPYTQEVRIDRTREFMVEDQRFVQDRADVLVYQTEPLAEDLTVAGPLDISLFISSTGTDADFIVKLIDVFPNDTMEHEEPADKYMDVPMSGYQMMVRGEVFRAKFRESLSNPAPLVPGEIAEIAFSAPDVFHTFKAGHRVMVQVQSSWFPLVDRNPQTFTNIFEATEEDFVIATQRVYRSTTYPSHITLRIMR